MEASPTAARLQRELISCLAQSLHEIRVSGRTATLPRPYGDQTCVALTTVPQSLAELLIRERHLSLVASFDGIVVHFFAHFITPKSFEQSSCSKILVKWLNG